MYKLVIQGGIPLSGSIKTSGSKNATLPIFFSSILADSPLKLANTPQLSDVSTTLRLLMDMGSNFVLEEDGSIFIDGAIKVQAGVVNINQTSTVSVDQSSGTYDGNTYKPYIDNSGRIVRLSPPDPEKFNVKNVEQLPKIKILSETGSGAILKPSLKPRPEYQGEIKEVIDCIS